MTRRGQTQIACERCRKKRSKCNGKIPCRGCVEAGEACEYNYTRLETKAELRAQIKQLKERWYDQDKTSRLASGQHRDARHPVHQELARGNLGDADDNAGQSRNAALPRVSHAEPTTTTTQGSVDSPCFGQLLSWKFFNHSFTDNLSAKIPKYSTILSLPAPPLDAYSSQSHLDIWTRTGWTKAHIRHLFDAILTWDLLPFCFIPKDLFMRDYHSGSDEFCSSALVHALLALATRIVNENNDDITVLPAGWFGSRFFFREAEANIQRCGPSNSLPNIQALGILSLYQIRCGRESEAQRLAKGFVTGMTELCRHEPLVGKDKQYARVRAATHCGAVSLTRMISLATGQLFNTDNHILHENPIYLDDISPHSGGTSPGSYDFRPDLDPNAHAGLWKLDVLPRKLFQLTEWVHQLIVSAQSDTQTATRDILPVYGKCLDWYKDFFLYINADGSRTPFVLFIHMYYHFCLLCAFRPFLCHNLGDSDVEPQRICTQAAQSILALAQSYDDLFSLRRVSGLVPYFVCASGLFSPPLEDNSFQMDPVYLRLRDDVPSGVKIEPRKHESSEATYVAPVIPSHIKMSAAAHARLLLARIGSTHPAATTAARVLQEGVQSQ